MYAELHCKTNFSFLQGASHPDELVTQAAQLGYAALAITDHNTLAGVVRAHLAAKQTGLPLLIGAQITPVDAPPCLLWAPHRTAYGSLCRLITHGRRRAEKGECYLTLEDISQHSCSLLAGVIPAWNGPLPGPVKDNSPLPCSSSLATHQHLSAYRDIFADRCYLLAELHHGTNDPAQIDALTSLSGRVGLPLVAAGNVHYHLADRIALHDVLTAIAQGTTVSQIGTRRFPNAQRHLRTLDQLRSIYQPLAGSLQRTLEVASRCTFSLEELRYEYPEELAPGDLAPITYLKELSWQGAQQRYPQGIPAKVRQLIEHELQLIEELHYEAYFLTVWDLVRFARSQDILCQGRGSAANSAICYCLGITSVDPDKTDVLFERFISRERNEAPDIDVDFEHERREEVLQYLYHKYGRERAGMTAVVTTYRSRSAIRDAGKALGLSLDRVDIMTKNIDGYARHAPLESVCQQADIAPQSPLGKRLISLVNLLIGFPRHLSQHVGGMVMTRGPLCELVPIENASMEDRTVIQWNKDDLDELGILKVDCLSLGMLTAIHKCFQLIKHHHDKTLTLASIPAGDEAVYDMICQADTIGVFQIESRAQMNMLPRLRPRNYYDLVIEVAIVRPGPIQGQMVHPYLRRRAGLEKAKYPNSQIRNVLKKTLGVPLFQEQAMRLAVVAAGFTPGEADQLRRAMGAWRRPGLIDQLRQKLILGMRKNNLSEKFARQVFEQIRGFGEYGFPESHAASFALLVYVSAWLKHHFPAIFTASLINSQPMGFYGISQLIQDAQRHDVQVLPIDINHSDWDCSLEHISTTDSLALRLGMRTVAGLPWNTVQQITRARSEKPFLNWNDFQQRTGLMQTALMQLAEADAFTSLGFHRRQAIWQALGQPIKEHPLPLFESLPDSEEPPSSLPRMTLDEEVKADYRTAGLSLKGHPLASCRCYLDSLQVTTVDNLHALKNHHTVQVAGLVLLKQRPSNARGITFVTLEDETGTVNLVIHQDIWKRYQHIARHSNIWIARGKLTSQKSLLHIIVSRLEDLSEQLATLQTRSRDFH